MLKNLRVVGWALVIVLVDQITKFLAVTGLRPVHSVAVIPGFLNFSYVENIGAAWGMLAGRQVFLIIFTLLTLAWLIWKRERVFGGIPLSRSIQVLLLGGIFGNLIDRIVRGYVVDFLDFYIGSSHFPCFNVADTAICSGAILLMAVQLFFSPSKV